MVVRLRRATWVASRRGWLTVKKNLSALADLSGRWIDLVHGRRPPKGIVLDMDSSVSPTHGEQENRAWNGHYACTCYHPLFVFNQFGDLERCALRPGNVHSAEGWGDVLKPVVVRYQGKVLRIYFRADAAFAMPGVYEYLEAERIKYVVPVGSSRNRECLSPIPRLYRGNSAAAPTRQRAEPRVSINEHGAARVRQHSSRRQLQPAIIVLVGISWLLHPSGERDLTGPRSDL
jgi:hypothetical protein